MDPKQTPPVGVNSNDIGSSATGRSVFSNPTNRFRDTSAKGDIIIPPSTPAPKPRGSKKKPLIIAAIIIVLIATVGVVVYFATRSDRDNNNGGFLGFIGGSDSSDKKGTIASANDFNAYSNYIVTGKADTSRLSEDLRTRYESPDSEEDYAILTAIRDNDTEFINTAKQYFDTFYTAYETERVEDLLSGLVADYKDNFDFIYQYAQTHELSSEELLSAYVSGADIEGLIAEKYAPYTSMENPIASDFVERAANYDRLMFNLYANYSAAGCIADGAINEDCVENMDALDPADLIDQISNASYDVDSFVENKLYDLIYGCWNIDTTIYEPDGTEKENTNNNEDIDLTTYDLEDEATEAAEATGEEP